MMRSLLLVVAVCATGASAFAPTAMKTRLSTQLSMAATGIPGKDQDTYLKKPLFHPKPTKPEPVKNVSWIEKQTVADAILDPNYFLTAGLLVTGAIIPWYHPSYTLDGTPSLIGIFGGGFHVLFAALLYVQTSRVRCVFEKDAFEFYNIEGPSLDLNKGARLVKKPNNYVSGTRNRWKYDQIINYGFFPSLEFPVICYFKETETPEEQWDKWFAAFDSYGRGQPHFFPGICNVHQFKEQMEMRGVKRKPIPTLKSTKGAKAQDVPWLKCHQLEH